jgi:hypothetical protein
MSQEILTAYWAPLMASVTGGALLIFVIWRLWLQSPRGQLAQAKRRVRTRAREADRARRVLEKSTSVLASLDARSNSLRPSRLREAREAVEDARALAKIAHDQLLVAENLLRKVIIEEFPPCRHESMRRRYLRPDEERGKSFSG